MDCRRRLRLGSGAAVVLAAALVGVSTHGFAQGPQPVSQGRPQVAPLRCPSQDSRSSDTTTASNDRVPAVDELAAIDTGRALSSRPAPRLPESVVQRFALPAGEGRLRVGVWGDSHIAAAFITEELAKHVEATGLAVETRFIPASVGRPGVRLPVRQVCKSGWQFQPSYNAPSSLAVGPSLANLRSTKAGDYLWLDLRQRNNRLVRSARLHYLPTRSSAIGLRIDDGVEIRYDLSQLPYLPGVIDMQASPSISTVKLRLLEGEMVFQGITLDYAQPANVTVDTFGIPSATVNSWSNVDVQYLRKSLDPDGYDAIILAYGTNEGAIGRFDASNYTSMLRSALRNVRAVFPDSACLLMGPTDRGVRIPQGPSRGRVDFLQYSRIHQEITRIQRDIGGQFGCALWDWQAVMGGSGSIYAWARATPALAAPDLIHLTLSGYRRSAAVLAQSIGWSNPQP